MPNIAPEFPFTGLALVEFRATAHAVNGCLQNAVQITEALDPKKSALLEIVRMAVMERLAIADVLLASKSEARQAVES